MGPARTLLQVSLIPVSGPRDGRPVRIEGPRAIIGRSPDCDIQALDEQASERHCRLHVDSDKVILENLSENGTLVNGRVVRDEFQLLSNDAFFVGARGFRVMIVETMSHTFIRDIRLARELGEDWHLAKQVFADWLEEQGHRWSETIRQHWQEQWPRLSNDFRDWCWEIGGPCGLDAELFEALVWTPESPLPHSQHGTKIRLNNLPQPEPVENEFSLLDCLRFGQEDLSDSIILADFYGHAIIFDDDYYTLSDRDLLDLDSPSGFIAAPPVKPVKYYPTFYEAIIAFLDAATR